MEDKDYIIIALRMLSDLAGDDTRLLAMILNAKLSYANTKKIACKKSVTTLIDKILDIFSKAKLQLEKVDEED